MAWVCELCGGGASPWPAILSLAAVGATWIAMVRLAGRAGLSPSLSGLAGLVGLAGGFWGAHLYGVLESGPASVLSDPGALLRVWVGSKAVMGAFVGAGLAAAALLAVVRRPLWPYADAWVPAVALGYGLARLGCFVNGDDFGVVSTLPWAVQFPAGTEAYAAHLARGWVEPGGAVGLPVHPTQLYHALVGLVGFLLLLRWRPRWPGQRVAVAMAWYGLTRLLIQLVRDDHWAQSQALDPAQWLSLGLLALAAGLWWANRESRRIRAPLERAVPR